MTTTSIQDTLTEILKYLNIPFSNIKVSEEEKITRVDIESEDPSRIIGWHGETLNAIQHLTKAIIRTKEKLDRAPFIVLDVDGYRRAQEDKVCRIADQKADFVRRTGNRVALAPMNPYFRRIVHTYVSNNPDMQDLTTESSGEGDYRQVVLRQINSNDNGNDEGGELSPVIEKDGDGLGNLDV
ncbi:KH domain-containing protein [Patescibacteria group bacterium]|nr:KH domain-containing protein [Patescibacteria group bacterium]MBU1123324.1 KH domain-containing protein [Patescibacteria group bacterium]MBU1911489.1 KH domain-containing protein [Patescibacteria group bacterium]